MTITIDGVDIVPHLSVNSVLENLRFCPTHGCNVVEVEIGTINVDTPGEIERHSLMIPTSRLLNGRKRSCITMCRFNQLMNIITSLADGTLGVDLQYNKVVFLGFIKPS